MGLKPETPLQRALRAVVRGDVDRLPEVLGVDHASLAAATDAMEDSLVVTSAAVADVVRGLREGRLGAADAQRWASFVRHGHGPGVAAPLRPIDIDYEMEGEDAIVEAVARLTELGDLVDGTIDDAEAAQLLSALVGPTPSS